MKRVILSFILFAFVINTQAQVNWLRDQEQAQRLAKATGKLIVMDFWAVWCGPCKAMDAKLWETEAINEVSDNFVALKVNVDYEKGLAGRYGIRGIPRVIVVTPKGDVIWDQTGFGGAGDFMEAFEALPTGLETLFAAQDEVDEEKSADNYFALAKQFQDVAATLESGSIQNAFFSRSDDFFTKAAKKAKGQPLAEMANLNKVYNQAIKGNAKKAMKRMAKLSLDEGDVSINEFATFLRAYCYKCQGENDSYEMERKKVKDADLLATLDKK